VDHQRRVVEAYGLLVGRCMNILHTAGHGSRGNTIARRDVRLAELADR
jgi:hypothetical protein